MKKYKIEIELKVSDEIKENILNDECDKLREEFVDGDDYKNIKVSWKEVKE